MNNMELKPFKPFFLNHCYSVRKPMCIKICSFYILKYEDIFFVRQCGFFLITFYSILSQLEL